MERAIGEIFELDGVKLRVDKSIQHCKGCFYENKVSNDSCTDKVRHLLVKCLISEREDKTDVVFTEVK